MLKRALTILAGNGFGKLALLAVEFFLIARLGVAEYGLFSIGLSVLLIVSGLSLLGLDFGVIHYLAVFQEQKRDDAVDNLIRWSLLVVGLVGLLAGLGLALGSHVIAVTVFDKPELTTPLVLIGLAVPLEALNQVMSAVFRGLRQFKNHVIVSDFVRNLILFIAIPFSIWGHMSLSLTLGFLLAGSLLGTITGIYLLYERVFSSSAMTLSSWPLVWKALQFSYVLFAWGVFQMVSNRGQAALAGMFLTGEEVGIFGALLRLTLLFTFIQSAVNQTVFVEFVRLNYLQDRKQLKYLLEYSATVLLIVGSLLALPIVLYPNILIGALSNRYSAFSWLIPILVVAQVVNVGTGPIGQLLVGCGKQSSLLAVSVVGSIIQVGLGLLLMPMYGLAGAIVASSATILVLTIMKHVLSARLLNIHFLNGTFFVLAGIGIVSAIAGMNLGAVTAAALGYDPRIVIAFLCYGILIAVYASVDRAFREQLLSMVGDVRKVIVRRSS